MSSRCPTCDSDLLELKGRRSTAAYCPAFLDEDGARHTHDNNQTYKDYLCMKCSHVFSIREPLVPCWCGWPHLEDHA